MKISRNPPNIFQDLTLEGLALTVYDEEYSETEDVLIRPISAREATKRERQ
jgi:uncharacterized DUF497 family protein